VTPEEEELAGLEEQDLRELLEEPPGGHNHGWERDLGGRWHSLDTRVREIHAEYLDQPPHPITPPSVRPFDEIPHGKVSSYTNLGCRCVECRKAMREWKRTRRV